MSESNSKAQDPVLSEEEHHRRLWLQYALQTPLPKPISPANLNIKRTSRGPA